MLFLFNNKLFPRSNIPGQMFISACFSPIPKSPMGRGLEQPDDEFNSLNENNTIPPVELDKGIETDERFKCLHEMYTDETFDKILLSNPIPTHRNLIEQHYKDQNWIEYLYVSEDDPNGPQTDYVYMKYYKTMIPSKLAEPITDEEKELYQGLPDNIIIKDGYEYQRANPHVDESQPSNENENENDKGKGKEKIKRVAFKARHKEIIIHIDMENPTSADYIERTAKYEVSNGLARLKDFKKGILKCDNKPDPSECSQINSSPTSTAINELIAEKKVNKEEY